MGQWGAFSCNGEFNGNVASCISTHHLSHVALNVAFNYKDTITIYVQPLNYLKCYHIKFSAQIILVAAFSVMAPIQEEEFVHNFILLGSKMCIQLQNATTNSCTRSLSAFGAPMLFQFIVAEGNLIIYPLFFSGTNLVQDEHRSANRDLVINEGPKFHFILQARYRYSEVRLA